MHELEKNHFEDNDKNSLPKMSLNKKMTYYGFCILLVLVIVYGLWYGEIVLPGKRNNSIHFTGFSLYILISSGLIWIFHLIVQIIGSDIEDSILNNKYFKFAYNSRILATVFLISAFIYNLYTMIQQDLQ